MTDISASGALPVSQLIGDEVVRVATDATIHVVAQALTNDGVGAVLLGDEGRPTALVSERDIVRSVAAGHDPASTPANTVASRELVWCDVESTVEEVAAEMLSRYIRHVLVEEDGELVGIVSARDLLGAYNAEGTDLSIS
jgi:signal-transduction protein with cAMP-binding, CBS, and nucleotidyltransferase domain